MDTKRLKRVSEYEWRIERAGKMQVDGVIFGSAELIRQMDEKVREQVSNVAALPGIVKASFAMPINDLCAPCHPEKEMLHHYKKEGGASKPASLEKLLAHGLPTGDDGPECLTCHQIPREMQVAVQDKRLDIVAITIPPGLGVDLEAAHLALGRQDELPEPLRNRKEAANASQKNWHQLLPVGDIQMARLISPIVSGDRARGYVSIVGQPDELDLLDMLTADYGAAA